MRKQFLSLSLLATLVLSCAAFMSATAQDPQTQQPSSTQPATPPDQQQPSSQPSPSSPSSTQPSSPATPPADQQQPSTSPSTSPATGALSSPTSSQSQAFTGQIVKMADKYVLQEAATGATHQLDDQDRAKTYDGKTVRVNGSLDASNVIHVESIEGAK